MHRDTKRRRGEGGSSAAEEAAACVVPRKAVLLKDPTHSVTLMLGLARDLREHGASNAAIPAVVMLRAFDLEGGAAQQIPVHSAVAASVSRPLQRMIAGSSGRAGGLASSVVGGVLTLPTDSGVDAASLRTLVDFMYSGELELTPSTAWALLSTSNFLELDSAKKLCEPFLSEQVSVDNVLDMLQAAGRFGCLELERTALDFVAYHFTEVVALDDFLTLSKDEVLSIARLDSLRVLNEVGVLNTLMRWADHAKPDREAAFGEFFADLEAVRLSQLPFYKLDVLNNSPRVGHELLIKNRVGAETFRRNQSGDDPSRPRRYTPSAVPKLSAVPTAIERRIRSGGRVMALVAFEEDKIISGGSYGVINVWNTANGASERTLDVLGRGIMSISLLTHGDFLFVGQNNGVIQAINTTSWTLGLTFEGHNYHVWNMLMDGEALISCSCDCIRVWSTVTGECERSVKSPSAHAKALVKCGGNVVSSEIRDNHRIIVWNTSSWTHERTLAGHTLAVDCLATTSDEGKLLSGSIDGSVKVWDTASWECERTIVIGSPLISILVNGGTIYSGCASGSIVVSNWNTGEHGGSLVDRPDYDVQFLTVSVRSLAVCGAKFCSVGCFDAVVIWA